MKPNIHFETDSVVIFTDKEINSVAVVYKRKTTSQEFRALHLELLKAFQISALNRLYVDIRKMEIAAPDDQKWLATTIIPQLAQYASSKFLHIAVVVNENIFTRLAVETVENISNDLGICIHRHFKTPTDAKEWLLTT
ncbi:STAS/SEC14 domain-containing protein [Adhaeribacter aquaticus]|uniref:STAS/SEC14 domain-containing protein n=1 Tax=Adhaeribacter aquaticus TaxID=299567 RepID=UPI00047B422E|nr:STAS/SEC14 domain-containing protein [Adhaeribacter aquaticus]